MDIYDHDRKLENVEKRILDADYSEDNKSLIFEFENRLFAEGLETSRVLKYMSQMNMISRWFGKNLADVDEKDVEQLVGSLERSSKKYSTKRDYKITIKKFFKWLYRSEKLEMVDWIPTKKSRENDKLPEDMLTPDDIKKMVDAAGNARDRAIIYTLYESAARISELANMKMRDVKFDEDGALIHLDGNTGPRTVRVAYSVPALGTWIEMHPNKNDKDAYVWINIGSRSKGQPMKYSSFQRLIIRTAKKANIDKNVHHHLFRHSRATELSQVIEQPLLEKFMGWVHGSGMTSVYLHLSDEDLDNAICNMYGRDNRKSKEPALKPQFCPFCDKPISPTSQLCTNCGKPLNAETAIDLDEKRKQVADVMQLLISDPELNQL